MSVREIKTVDEFNRLKTSGLKYVLLYFYGQECLPCQTLFSTIKSTLRQKKYQNVIIYKINGPKLRKLMNDYNIKLVPAIILLDVTNDTYELVNSSSLNISKVEEKMELIKNNRNVSNIGTLIKLEDEKIISKSSKISELNKGNKFFVVILDDKGNELKFTNKENFAKFITNNHEHFQYLAGGSCDIGKSLPYIKTNDESKIDKKELEEFIGVVNKKVNTVIGLL